ncbi:Glycosyltransferase involved in cell wall bisynthesis [Micromonospora echinaurantiaca]|uniref:Glycosyltransferase involved in cell wall bisynthesis n=1 Tax=Micromonospora echinaurantiaca TaxID=47857 RepID=A0A1C5JNC7_9ACTN|nr:glycosyltransferase [Micromonospora echinaurantiaca]SCG72092.1 Glycosyltransferase involved in cell wall bisynthesis [Micromonospora echinaurantiaca]
MSTTAGQTPPVGQQGGLPALADSSVALVHEWFGVTGGSEKVFRHIADLVPHAERFVLWKDSGVEEPQLRESWLARTPLRHSKAAALPLMPMTWRTLTRQRFDVVISSSHAFAHTVKLGPPETTRHLSYVHAPARYIWSPAFDGRGSSPLLALPRRALQAVDVRFSRHVHSYAANSREVQARIRHYWRRDAVVVNPPVDVDYFSSAPAADQAQPRDYLLGVGRWIPYKRFDLIIEIAEAAGLPVVIAGSGPEEANLRRLAERVRVPVTVEVMPSMERLRQLYWGARALLFPVHEDFGIIPVEAQACGTPVIGINRGGLLETVVDGETGFLIDSTTPDRFAALTARLGELHTDRIRANAATFSAATFAAKFSAWVTDAVA